MGGSGADLGSAGPALETRGWDAALARLRTQREADGQTVGRTWGRSRSRGLQRDSEGWERKVAGGGAGGRGACAGLGRWRQRRGAERGPRGAWPGGRWAGAAVMGGAWPAAPSCGVAQARLSGAGPGIRGSGRTWWGGRRANAV